jgi:HAD superfamily phosphatase (TIGR01668 family)
MAATTSPQPTTSTNATEAPEPSAAFVGAPAAPGWWGQLCPRYTATALELITPAWLGAAGIRAVILDMDNTLVAWHEEDIRPEVESWIASLREAGFQLCVASNTHRPRRLRRLAGRLQVLCAPRVAKPRRGGFLRAMAAMGAAPGETAVVGDQVLTDIWGGNRCGLLTLLVSPLSPREFVGTRLVSRQIERWLLKRFAARGWLRAIEG